MYDASNDKKRSKRKSIVHVIAKDDIEQNAMRFVRIVTIKPFSKKPILATKNSTDVLQL